MWEITCREDFPLSLLISETLTAEATLGSSERIKLMWHQDNTTRCDPPPMLTFCSSMVCQCWSYRHYEVFIEATITVRQAVNACALSMKALWQFNLVLLDKMFWKVKSYGNVYMSESVSEQKKLANSVSIFLEHGCYVKSDPRSHWPSGVECAVHQNPGTGCSFVPLHGK